jgi:ribosomal protein L37AE/L43A
MKIEQILSGIFQIAGDAPELNLNNYTEEEVEKLYAVCCPICGKDEVETNKDGSWCINCNYEWVGN